MTQVSFSLDFKEKIFITESFQPFQKYSRTLDSTEDMFQDQPQILENPIILLLYSSTRVDCFTKSMQLHKTRKKPNVFVYVYSIHLFIWQL